LLPVGLLLTAAIFGLNNVADAEIEAHDSLKQTNGVNPIAMGQVKERKALIPNSGCGLLPARDKPRKAGSLSAAYS